MTSSGYLCKVHSNSLRHFMAVLPCHDFVTDFHFVKELSIRNASIL